MKFSKTHMYIAIAVLVFLIVFAVYFYRKGKSKTSTQYLPGDLPYGQPGNGGAGSNAASNSEIKSIADALHNDMDGFNWSGHDMEPYQRAMVLSDTDFVKLYNTFNSLYQKDSKQTLKQWIDNEKFISSSLPDAMLNRMAKLNLV